MHRTRCANVANIRDFAERRVELIWHKAESRPTFWVEIVALPDCRLFASIERAIERHGGVLVSGADEEPAPPVAETDQMRKGFAVAIEGDKQLRRLVHSLRRLPAVREVAVRHSGAGVR